MKTKDLLLDKVRTGGVMSLREQVTLAALLSYPALASFSNRMGYEEVNALKWNGATAKLKQVYESVVK